MPKQLITSLPRLGGKHYDSLHSSAMIHRDVQYDESRKKMEMKGKGQNRDKARIENIHKVVTGRF